MEWFGLRTSQRIYIIVTYTLDRAKPTNYIHFFQSKKFVLRKKTMKLRFFKKTTFYTFYISASGKSKFAVDS